MKLFLLSLIWETYQTGKWLIKMGHIGKASDKDLQEKQAEGTVYLEYRLFSILCLPRL